MSWLVIMCRRRYLYHLYRFGEKRPQHCVFMIKYRSIIFYKVRKMNNNDIPTYIFDISLTTKKWIENRFSLDSDHRRLLKNKVLAYYATLFGEVDLKIFSSLAVFLRWRYSILVIHHHSPQVYQNTDLVAVKSVHIRYF